MDTLNYKNIETYGDILYRAKKNMERMESEPYRPDKFFQDSSYNWPGDWEGRTLLAIVSDEKVLKTSAKYMPKLFEELEKHLNEDKYFGEKLGEVLSEQLMAGNSWFLRALCEHYYVYNDEQSLRIINTIADKLLVKVLPYYKKYPVDMSVRKMLGEAIGDLLSETVDGWKLSTDTACAFIPLDGLTQVFEIAPRPELKELIETAVEIFCSIDKVGIHCQTHASLSATRGILRWYGITGDKKYLNYAIEVFNLYVQKGMTENYANFNWFGRPEWTEGCAVVDSMSVAMDLFRFTGKGYYAAMANKIYLNAFRFSQRGNGGMGCDMCTTPNQPYLCGGEGVFEAFWCCSMRCGEGIYKLSEFQYLTEGDTVTVPLYNDNRAEIGGILISQKTGYPFKGDIVFEIKTEKPFNLRLYVPENCENVKVNGAVFKAQDNFVSVRIEESGKYEVHFDLVLKTVFKGEAKEYFYGDLMLGEIVSGEVVSELCIEVDGLKLVPIADMSKLDFEKSKIVKQRVVF